jgi:hypothetical protein
MNYYFNCALKMLMMERMELTPRYKRNKGKSKLEMVSNPERIQPHVRESKPNQTTCISRPNQTQLLPCSFFFEKGKQSQPPHQLMHKAFY